MIGIKRAERTSAVDSWEGPLKIHQGEGILGEEAGCSPPPLYMHAQKAAEIL